MIVVEPATLFDFPLEAVDGRGLLTFTDSRHLPRFETYLAALTPEIDVPFEDDLHTALKLDIHILVPTFPKHTPEFAVAVGECEMACSVALAEVRDLTDTADAVECFRGFNNIVNSCVQLFNGECISDVTWGCLVVLFIHFADVLPIRVEYGRCSLFNV